MTKNFLYESTAVNEEGVNGQAYIKNENGLRVTVSSPLNKEPGTNPEELLGLSLSTCFHATLKAILKEQQIKTNSRVEVPVQLKKEIDQSGYYFEVTVQVAIENLDSQETSEIIFATSQRCPVYKLMKESHTVSLDTIPY